MFGVHLGHLARRQLLILTEAKNKVNINGMLMNCAENRDVAKNRIAAFQ